MRWFETQTRAAKILQLLERRTVFEPKRLSEKLGVSTKTVRNEISRLNDELGEAARIEMNNGLYRLYIFNSSRFSEIRDLIIKPENSFDNSQSRMAYIADLLFNSKDYILIDDMAFDINVSRTTLVKDLNRLKKIFKNYDIEVIGKANTGIQISGSEFSIRKFILENIYDLIYTSSVLDPDLWEHFFRIMNEYNLENSTVTTIGKHLVLSLDRYLNGYPILFNDKEVFYDLKEMKLFKVINQLIDDLTPYLGVELPLEERLFLMIPLAGMRTPVNVSALEDLIDLDSETIELVNRIINEIHNETDLSFQFDDSLDDFIYHITFLLNRLKYGMFLENPVKDEMQSKYGFAWNLAERTARIIEKATGKKVNSDEIGFLTSYYEVIIREQENKAQKKFKVLVIHHKGGAAMRLITYQLERILGSDAEIKSLPYRPGESYRNGYDLIITTGHMDLQTDKPVIELDEVVDEAILKQQIDTVKYTRGLNLPNTNKNPSILLSLLDDSKIFIFNNETAYEEAIRDMSGSLIEQGYADTGFAQRIEEREQKSSMVFSDEVAFPHTIHKAGDKPFAALGLVPNGLKDKKGLRVIIMAGLPEEADDDLTLVQLYEEIVRLSENKTIVSDLSKLSSYYDILNLFIIKHQLFG